MPFFLKSCIKLRRKNKSKKRRQNMNTFRDITRPVTTEEIIQHCQSDSSESDINEDFEKNETSPASEIAVPVQTITENGHSFTRENSNEDDNDINIENSSTCVSKKKGLEGIEAQVQVLDLDNSDVNNLEDKDILITKTDDSVLDVNGGRKCDFEGDVQKEIKLQTSTFFAAKRDLPVQVIAENDYLFINENTNKNDNEIDAETSSTCMSEKNDLEDIKTEIEIRDLDNWDVKNLEDDDILIIETDDPELVINDGQKCDFEDEERKLSTESLETEFIVSSEEYIHSNFYLEKSYDLISKITVNSDVFKTIAELQALESSARRASKTIEGNTLKASIGKTKADIHILHETGDIKKTTNTAEKIISNNTTNEGIDILTGNKHLIISRENIKEVIDDKSANIEYLKSHGMDNEEHIKNENNKTIETQKREINFILDNSESISESSGVHETGDGIDHTAIKKNMYREDNFQVEKNSFESDSLNVFGSIVDSKSEAYAAPENDSCNRFADQLRSESSKCTSGDGKISESWFTSPEPGTSLLEKSPIFEEEEDFNKELAKAFLKTGGSYQKGQYILVEKSSENQKKYCRKGSEDITASRSNPAILESEKFEVTETTNKLNQKDADGFDILPDKENTIHEYSMFDECEECNTERSPNVNIDSIPASLRNKYSSENNQNLTDKHRFISGDSVDINTKEMNLKLNIGGGEITECKKTCIFENLSQIEENKVSDVNDQPLEYAQELIWMRTGIFRKHRNLSSKIHISNAHDRNSIADLDNQQENTKNELEASSNQFESKNVTVNGQESLESSTFNVVNENIIKLSNDKNCGAREINKNDCIGTKSNIFQDEKKINQGSSNNDNSIDSEYSFPCTRSDRFECKYATPLNSDGDNFKSCVFSDQEEESSLMQEQDTEQSNEQDDSANENDECTTNGSEQNNDSGVESNDHENLNNFSPSKFNDHMIDPLCKRDLKCNRQHSNLICFDSHISSDSEYQSEIYNKGCNLPQKVFSGSSGSFRGNYHSITDANNSKSSTVKLYIDNLIFDDMFQQPCEVKKSDKEESIGKIEQMGINKKNNKKNDVFDKNRDHKFVNRYSLSSLSDSSGSSKFSESGDAKDVDLNANGSKSFIMSGWGDNRIENRVPQQDNGSRSQINAFDKENNKNMKESFLTTKRAMPKMQKGQKIKILITKNCPSKRKADIILTANSVDKNEPNRFYGNKHKFQGGDHFSKIPLDEDTNLKLNKFLTKLNYQASKEEGTSDVLSRTFTLRDLSEIERKRMESIEIFNRKKMAVLSEMGPNLRVIPITRNESAQFIHCNVKNDLLDTNESINHDFLPFQAFKNNHVSQTNVATPSISKGYFSEKGDVTHVGNLSESDAEYSENMTSVRQRILDTSRSLRSPKYSIKINKKNIQRNTLYPTKPVLIQSTKRNLVAYLAKDKNNIYQLKKGYKIYRPDQYQIVSEKLWSADCSRHHCNQNHWKTSPDDLRLKFDNVFRKYASKGRNNGELISYKRSTEWLRDAGVLGVALTAEEANDAFKCTAGGKVALNKGDYRHFLKKLTRVKRLNYHEIYESMCKPIHRSFE